MEHITGTIAKAHRLPNSPDGNPTWRITLDDGREYRTARDSQAGFGPSESHEGRTVTLAIRRGEIVEYVSTPGD